MMSRGRNRHPQMQDETGIDEAMAEETPADEAPAETAFTDEGQAPKAAEQPDGLFPTRSDRAC